MIRKTSIIASIGPASDSEEMIKKLILAGVNVIRINFSHSREGSVVEYVNRVKKVREKLNKSVAIMVDTRGPEIRVRKFKENKVMLKKGNFITFTSKEVEGSEDIVTINQKVVVDNAKIGGTVLANDGKLVLKIVDKKQDQLVCKILTTGALESNKSLSFKNQAFKFDYLNEADKEDLKNAVSLGAEYIAASFVNCAEDVIALNEYVKEYAEDVKVIAKIENAEGIKNVNSILKHCFGLMVARGDLGVEVDFEKLPTIQRQLINAANDMKKVSIVATEMLDSMITSIRPTRAEISDVAKAVFDGGKAVMLSAESAVGRDPVGCVKVLNKILLSAENVFDYKNHFNKSKKNPQKANDLVIQSALDASSYLKIKAISTFTSKGNNARKLANSFCEVPVVAITNNKKTFNALAMLSNTIAVFEKDKKDIFTQAKNVCLDQKIAKAGETIIVTTGEHDDIANVMKFEIV